MLKRRSRLLVPAAAAILALLSLAVLYVLAPPQLGSEALLRVVIPQRGPPEPSASVPATPTPDATSTRNQTTQSALVATVTAPAATPAEIDRPPAARAIDAEWERRAVSANPLPGRALVAIVLDDMGLDRTRAMRAIGLPAPLTLSFLPYGRDAPALAVLARQRGHEVLLHMPMQPLGTENPGPQALSVDLGPQEVRMRVGAALDRFGDAVGLNNHMGSRFTSDRSLMAPVMEELAARGLIFVDSRTANATQGAVAADLHGVPAVMRDVFLDNEITREAVLKQIAELELLAKRHGAAIAIGHPHDVTLVALAGWLPTLAERGFQAVPVTTIVRRKLANGGGAIRGAR